MEIFFGHEAYELKKGNKKPVVWDSKKLINGHVLLVGKSGMGKTYTLKDMINQLYKSANKEGKKIRCHIMDVHGDIDVDGASVVKFSESTNYGFNPLVINPDKDFGGVRKRIQTFISTLNRTGFKLGPKQESALRNILLDLYSANGFYENDYKTWTLNDPKRKYKKNPTLEDACRFSNSKLKSMFLGTSSLAISSLEKVNRKQIQIQKKLKEINKTENSEDIRVLKEEFDKISNETQELFKQYLDNIKSGNELNDLIKYDSKDVMKSVVERLENLNSIGIFKNETPPFDPNNPIWRYDIKALSTDEKKIFVSFILESIFFKAMERGLQDDVVEIIVIDEAHIFVDDKDDNPINIIAKEARKYGVGLWAASQSTTHFHDDFTSNVSTKIILGIDQLYWESSKNKLQLKIEAFEWLKPHKNYLIQLNNKGDTKNAFNWVWRNNR